MRIRVGQAFSSVFYAPYYVALHGGFFDHEDLEVLGTVFGDGKRVVEAIQEGDVDVAIGGIVRSLIAYDQGAEAIPVQFARINDRDGFFVLGRQRTFIWPDLMDKSLMIFSEAPTPWYLLRAFLLEQGLDPSRVRVIDGVPSSHAAALFLSGEGDFLQAPASVVDELIEGGAAVLLCSMGQVLGPLPYSSYYALPSVYNNIQSALEGFVRAHARAVRWMQKASARDICDTIRPSFPGGDPELLSRAIKRYQSQSTWLADLRISKPSFERLADLLRQGGLISCIAPYELVCRNELAERVFLELGSG